MINAIVLAVFIVILFIRAWREDTAADRRTRRPIERRPPKSCRNNMCVACYERTAEVGFCGYCGAEWDRSLSCKDDLPN